LKSSRSPETPQQPASTEKRLNKTFNYRTIGGGCLRPGVSIGLIDPSGNILSTRPVGLVDSGCDSTTLPLEWAERLGIDHATECLKFQGGTAGGKADQFLYEPGIHATFLGKKLRLGAIFAPHCPVVLLGRQDFFRYFTSINFEQEEQKMHLEGVADWEAAGTAVDASLAELATGIKAQIVQGEAEKAAQPTSAPIL
jgi:hypothetical protein